MALTSQSSSFSLPRISPPCVAPLPCSSSQVLWGALLNCYGSKELAEEAIVANPQILNPSYSFCNTMLASKEVLVNMMGKEDALDVDHSDKLDDDLRDTRDKVTWHELGSVETCDPISNGRILVSFFGLHFD